MSEAQGFWDFSVRTYYGEGVQEAAAASNVRRYFARLGIEAEGRVAEQLDLIMAAQDF